VSASPPADVWTVIASVFGGVLLFLGLLRVYQVRAKPNPELVRKLFHLGGGALGLAMPWLFDTLWPVLVLAGACVAVFAALRLVPALAAGPGQVLSAVKRNTLGEFWFVASFCLLFWLAAGNRLLYAVPLLVLTVADTAAALVGEEYGKLQYATHEGEKSLEGSVAFFLATFLSVHIPVLLLAGTGRAESLLIAFTLALMVTLAEAVTWWGLDNLIIPLFAFGLLKTFLGMDLDRLVLHLSFLLGLAVFVRLWRRRSTLADDALVGGVLWGYVVWALSDWRWIVPPVALFLTYLAVSPRTDLDDTRVIGLPALLASVAAGQIWVLLYWSTGREVFYYAFAAAFAANLATIAFVRDVHARPRAGRTSLLLTDTAKGALLVLVPSAAVLRHGGAMLVQLVLGSVAAFSAVLAFTVLQPGLEDYPIDDARWVRQAVITTAASGLWLGLYLAAPWGWLSGALAPAR
jgi:phytol kinase